MIHSNKNSTLIVYYRYYDAYIAIEFFKNPLNFKDETYKDKFKINWLNIENDLHDFPDHILSKINEIRGTVPVYSNSLLNNGMSSNNKVNNQFINNFNNLNIHGGMSPMTQINPMSNYHMSGNSGMTPQRNTYQWNNMNNIQNNGRQITNFNSGNTTSKFNTQIEEETTKGQSGKYTCRYELLIENDKDFQVARKLIGAKGCNMKRIVESCGSTDNDVKLRLRGQGSGFKEGPMNKESDDPLHLCISTKNPEKYVQACQLVEDLINGIFEEYKKFCFKFNKTGISKIFVKKEEGLALKLPQQTNQASPEKINVDITVKNSEVTNNTIPSTVTNIMPNTQNQTSKKEIKETKESITDPNKQIEKETYEDKGKGYKSYQNYQQPQSYQNKGQYNKYKQAKFNKSIYGDN